jgi:hypothetical protein
MGMPAEGGGWKSRLVAPNLDAGVRERLVAGSGARESAGANPALFKASEPRKVPFDWNGLVGK